MRHLLIWAGLLVTSPVLASPLYSVPAPSAQQIAAALAPSSGPYRVGIGLPLELDSAVDGVWFEQDGRRVWEAEVFADGADALSLHFSHAQLPADSTLLLRGSDGSRQGPYSAKHVRGGQLWTGSLKGESVTLRMDAPLNAPARLGLGTVYYGFREALGAPSKSGDCNIGVACGAANPYQNQVRSTVLLQFVEGNSLFSCSGLLVNNTRNDRTPYILTADHCGIDSSNQDSVQVYWKYQYSTCVQPGDHVHRAPSASTSVSGVEFLADGPSSDFTLLVAGSAANPAVLPSSFEPYWSGWDVGLLGAQSGVGVHHPSGNEKSLSIFDTPVQPALADIDQNRTLTWAVIWAQGTTEPGSSGSGLWNQDGRLVGVLSGGGASCASLNEADFYGRLHIAWTEGLACDQQLRYWLDPDFSGALTHDGTDGSSPARAPSVPACNGQVAAGPSATPAPTPAPTPRPTAPPGGSGGGGGVPGICLLGLALAGLRRRRGLVG